MELLAPAGNPQALRAAIANGADAVYLGGQQFSARHSAENFTREEIKEAILYAHLHGRKIYLTVNTLLDKKELIAALDDIYDLYRQGIDAVIVQDLGLLQALRNLLPELRIHASTQMTIHNRESCQLLQEQGVRRVVLAREMALEEIRQVKQGVPDLELEVFVHGALCYSYSGQCLFSSIVGGRSGNRGRCAQPCRLSYHLCGENSKVVQIEDNLGSHLLSLTDLCLLDHLHLLEDAGVNSLKIEGRMKRPEYVAVVTRVYRQALDRLQETGVGQVEDEEARSDLLKIFNRTFSTGYLLPQTGGLLSAKRPNNRGALVGRVIEQDADLETRIKLAAPLQEGDGVEIWVSRGKNPALVVKNMRVEGQSVENAEPGSVVSFKLNGRVAANDRVFKTHDQKLITRAMESIRGKDTDRIPLHVEAWLEPGEPLRLCFTDPEGFQVKVETANPAVEAQQHPLDKTTLEGKIDRLGQTPYRLGALDFHNHEPLIIAFREINQARRQAVEKLLSLRIGEQARSEPQFEMFKQTRERLMKPLPTSQELPSTRLSVSVSSCEEARAALRAGAQRVYLGLEGLGSRKKPVIQNIVSLVEEARGCRAELVPALPRIQKPGELDAWQPLVEAGVRTVMAGNLGGIRWGLERGLHVCADYSLNVFNPLSLDFLLRLGVEEACLSPELDLTRLQEFAPGQRVEILVHGDVLLMLSECCIMREIQGKEACGLLCQQESLGLKDDKGYQFPVSTDAYCRLYLFNSRTLCLMENLSQILRLQPGGIRMDLRLSNAKEIDKQVSLYREALEALRKGRRNDLADIRQRLIRDEDQMYTRGHFLRGVQ
ncbi:MAG TPA: DUF3656 domain-containing protein [Syntrophomonadaceae bacterium]|nr:DUF3656 domain-containing protein [Syntrophomonadaceae bacterium]